MHSGQERRERPTGKTSLSLGPGGTNDTYGKVAYTERSPLEKLRSSDMPALAFKPRKVLRTRRTHIPYSRYCIYCALQRHVDMRQTWSAAERPLRPSMGDPQARQVPRSGLRESRTAKGRCAKALQVPVHPKPSTALIKPPHHPSKQSNAFKAYLGVIWYHATCHILPTQYYCLLFRAPEHALAPRRAPV